MAGYSLYNPSPMWGRSADDLMEQKMKQLDVEGEMRPADVNAYVERLLGANDFLKQHIPADRTGNNDALRRQFLNESGLASGPTNFWDKPYISTGLYEPQVRQVKMHSAAPKDNMTYAEVYHSRPYDLNFYTENLARHAYPSSRVIPHELGHTKTGVDKLSRAQGYGQVAWVPKFTPEFEVDLRKLTQMQGPYFKGELGYEPDETMGYLMGREGELRSGKTLLDDPYTRILFKKHPGMYEEYFRAKTELKKIQGRQR